MKSPFASTSHKSLRSYTRVSTLLAALVVVGVLTAGFMVVSGRAATLGVRWPASLTRNVAVSGTDTPTISISGVSVNESAGTATFVVTQSAVSPLNTTFTYSRTTAQ